MSFFRNERHEQERQEHEESKAKLAAEADSLILQALETVNEGLQVKRQVREGTARFIGELRPPRKAG